MALPEPRIDPEDELVCLGHDEDLAAQGGALAPPIVQTSLFAQASLADLMTGFGAEHRHHVYTRGQNPTVEAVEHKLARLEGGAACKCFGSGMAAVSAVLMGLLASGDHVLFVNNTYGPTIQLAAHLRRFGVAFDVVLDLEPEAVAAAIRPETKMLWVESPGTMLFRVADLRALAGLARERGITSVIDNSWATPLYQKPLALGLDLAVHSATKYVGGHSDVVAGAVVGGEELLERIFYGAFLLNGGILGPFDAWLLNRGLRTLPVRMRQHHRDALEVARFLDQHAGVRQVFHPGLRPDALVREQLRGFSGLFSFELDTESFEDVERFVDRLELFRIGVSWGGVESLVITPNNGRNAASLRGRRIPPGTVRLSIGLEGAGVLIADLERALATAP
ncbi:MAG TPA: aminotransferase class I/II-fold pyridoxal phosphate-dependent enzyme [Thermoanaerobaculia bacterium]